MAVSVEPKFIDGIWGPYFNSMVPGFWLTEGGQSATGSLLDHVIHSHIAFPELKSIASQKSTSGNFRKRLKYQFLKY
jgi:ribulose kinase